MTELLDLASRIAALAQPGEELEAFVARGHHTSVKAYDGEVESLTAAESMGIGIRVVRDQRQGMASAGTLDEDVIAETLAEARDNCGFGEPDEFFGLARQDGVAAIEHDLWCDALETFPTTRKVALALALEAATKAGDPRITGVRTASFGDSGGEAAVATSTGIAIQGRANLCHVSVTALASDGTETTVGGGVDVGRDPQAIDIEKAANDAVERAVRLLGARSVPSQRVTMVLEPRLAATIMAIVGGMLTGERVLKGRSPFADRVGETIAATAFTLVDDPTDPRSLGADAYDGEGLACRRNTLIDGGVLQGFLHNCYTGRRAGTPSTGSAVRGYASTPGVGLQAMALAPGGRDHDDLVADVDLGVLVQSMTGLHSGVNAVSGDFSVGVEGLMIRDGALAEPVREVTVASTLQRLLLDIRAVGSDLEWLPSGTGGATIVIDDIALSGA